MYPFPALQKQIACCGYKKIEKLKLNYLIKF